MHDSILDELIQECQAGRLNYSARLRTLSSRHGAVEAARLIAKARQQAAQNWRDWQPADDAPDATQTRTTQRMAREREALRDSAFDPNWDTRKCPQCGQVFRVTSSNATKKQYCSAACSNAARQARHRAARITGK